MEKKGAKIRVRAKEGGNAWELAPLATSPCTLACPTRINARGYVSLVSDGRFSEALALIRERNPFPGVCGRVCPRPCEAACTRGSYDEAIAICALKRFVFDLEMKRGIEGASPAPIHRTEKIAVVGAGPAGLSAARELALLGHPVTVFEAQGEPGGMMNLIPEFRLPRAVVRRESLAILDRGIEFVGGVEFGKDITWRELKRRGFKALLLATGAWRPAPRWGAKGIDGVFHALDFLRHAALEVEGKSVIVAGNGIMGLDAARTAVRLGAKRVTLVAGTSRGLAPVRAEELAQAEEEGVGFVFLARVTRFVTTGTRLAGVRLVRLKELPPDATGRRELVEITGSEFAGAADIFVDAHGRGVDARRLRRELPLSMSRARTVSVDPATMSAGVRGVFAAGDLVAGPRSVVEAIASGQKAAYGIHRHLTGETVRSPFDLTLDEETARREFTLESVPEKKTRRAEMPLGRARARRRDFEEVEKGYAAHIAKREAQRCLRCGPCDECEVCVDICDKKDFVLRVGDDFVVNVHAGREFWSRTPERVVLEAGEERAEARPIRTVCSVDEELCIGCGRCEETCRYKAVTVHARPRGGFVARVDELACKGCGNCVMPCPTGAIDQRNYEHAEIMRKLATVAPSRTKVLFVCHWAAPARLDFPGDVLVIETMCAGRVTAQHVMEAVRRGSPRVLVCGCGPAECRYTEGRANTERVIAKCRKLCELLGLDPATVAELSTRPRDFHAAVSTWARKAK